MWLCTPVWCLCGGRSYAWIAIFICESNLTSYWQRGGRLNQAIDTTIVKPISPGFTVTCIFTHDKLDHVYFSPMKPTVGRPTVDRRSTDRSVDCRPTVGRVSVESRPTVDWRSTDSRPTYRSTNFALRDGPPHSCVTKQNLRRKIFTGVAFTKERSVMKHLNQRVNTDDDFQIHLVRTEPEIKHWFLALRSEYMRISVRQASMLWWPF